nr:uncharacterized protein LOC129386371 [Dermacentor andersoni]
MKTKACVIILALLLRSALQAHICEKTPDAQVMLAVLKPCAKIFIDCIAKYFVVYRPNRHTVLEFMKSICESAPNCLQSSNTSLTKTQSNVEFAQCMLEVLMMSKFASMIAVHEPNPKAVLEEGMRCAMPYSESLLSTEEHVNAAAHWIFEALRSDDPKISLLN